MAGTHTKINELGFRSGIGFTLGIAFIVACGRIFIRIRQNHHILLDDAFFFLALVTLIAGTSTTYVDIPYIYLQEDVQAGVRMPPPDFIQQLLRSVKIQDAAVVLLSTTLLSVKLSFLFFFRHLLRRLRKMMIWWWFVLAVTVPSTIVLICSNFISCSYFDERIFVKCVTPSALSRENATLKAVTILDLLSDLLILTIPILLLWGVKISLQRKLALGTILCLSVFTMIICIIRISGGNTANGQIDTAWVIFWLQVEAAVAVIIVSVTAYRTLFVAEKNSHYRDSPLHQPQPQPQHQQQQHQQQVTTTTTDATSSRARFWTLNHHHRSRSRGSSALPSIPAPTLLSGVRGFVMRAGGEKEMHTTRSDDDDGFVPLSDLDDKRGGDGSSREDRGFV